VRYWSIAVVSVDCFLAGTAGDFEEPALVALVGSEAREVSERWAVSMARWANIDSASTGVIQAIVAVRVTLLKQATHPHENRATLADPAVNNRSAICPNESEFPSRVAGYQVLHSNYYSCLFVLPALQFKTKVRFGSRYFFHITQFNAQNGTL
jgi:hypothetical protein